MTEEAACQRLSWACGALRGLAMAASEANTAVVVSEET
eukprot:COSAG01_NODE_3923_length_5530_cov_16.244338_1_plen_37_part_10